MGDRAFSFHDFCTLFKSRRVIVSERPRGDVGDTMEITRLFTDETAVSPVIGVILVVAITVILSAVIGTFALGLGTTQDTAPQSTWEKGYTDDDSDTLELTHASGDPMEPARLSIAVSGAACSSGSLESPKNLATDYSMTGTVSAGDSVAVDNDHFCSDGTTSDLDLKPATVRLVWEDEDTDDQADSATLATWTGQEA